jgi:hypothetical protein
MLKIARGRPAAAEQALRSPKARRRGVYVAFLVGLATACLAACSSTGDAPLTFFADPGKYQYHNCEQLAVATKQTSSRQQELKTLMEKAEQSTGGVVASTLAYRSDYIAATEELKVLDATARNKNCDTPATWRSNSTIR